MYIDPGVFGTLIPVVIGFIVSIPFIIKTYGARIKSVFKKKAEKPE